MSLKIFCEDIMKKYIDAIEKNRKLILDTQDYVWKNAETGWREYKTSHYMENVFESLGYNLVKGENVPGFYTVIDTGREGPEILILGELDSLICREHPDANPETGAVHCCGHSAQCAALVGIAAALREKDLLSTLSGRIRLCAVPAEELIEIDYRKSLMEKGIISHMGGKTEFLSRGYFDGVDIAFMIHTSTGNSFMIQTSRDVGCIAKKITYKGKSAHAGGCPWDGINALYAATQGLSAINALRETFREQDCIRVHPIITKGGSAVNAIPDEVTIESYVRGASFDAIKEANDQVNRALCGAALSMGANIEIEDIPGYAPLIQDKTLAEAAEKVFHKIMPSSPLTIKTETGTASTDMGDLSCVFPSLHFYAPGAVGTSHGKDYFINDKEASCVQSAIWQLSLAAYLLENNAAKAHKVLNSFSPLFKSGKEYIEFLNTLSSSGERIEYLDKKACVKL